MKYIITKTEPLRPYFGHGEGDLNLYCRDLYTLFDISCVEISEVLFDTVYPLIPAGYEEVTEDEAKFGSQFFSEVRPTVKILNPKSMMAETEGMPESEKIEYTFSDEVKGYIVSFMYRFAKEIIETEYNYRFYRLRNTTELEQASWEIQKHEAREWLTYSGSDGHITPFLDYLSVERGLDKTALSAKILEKSEEYADRLSTALVKYQLLLKEFESATTVWDMNIQYEKYFGIMVPASQSAEMGLQDQFNRRIFIDPDTGEKMIDQNNPYFGNKLNF
tara:strand:- start:3422 stop:4249 length:828 start_codon:yes stop_codon:yes gene_type:complete